MKIKILIIFSVFISGFTFAQEVITVKGTVKDQGNQVMPGASVIEKGTSNATVTNNNGTYQIKVKAGAALIFKYLGSKSVEQKVNGRTTIDVQLEDDQNKLDEVVVIGYGIKGKREDIPGAVSSVSGDELAKVPVQNVAQALQGRIAGMQVTMSDGTPGDDPKIVIRSGTSITQSNEPLYVVDGVPQEGGLGFLDPMDIDDITVLKDASSTALYGSRGANGVVLVTTKKLKSNKVVIGYDNYFGYKKVTSEIPVMNAYGYTKLQYEKTASTTAGLQSFTNTYGPYADLEKNYQGKGVNWQQEVMGKTVKNQYHKISIGGGGTETKFNLFFSRNVDEGILAGSGSDKNIGKLALNHTISKNFRINTIINYSDQKTYGIGTQSGGTRFNLLTNLIQYRPTFGLNYSNDDLINMDEDPDLEGTTNGALLHLQNPITSISSSPRESNSNSLNFNTTLEYNFLKHFSYRGLVSLSRGGVKDKNFTSPENVASIRNGGASGRINEGINKAYSFNNSITYSNLFNKIHKLDVTVGQEQVYSYSEFFNASASQFPSINVGWDNLGYGTVAGFPQSGASDQTLLSFFGRASYIYNNKYVVTASLRADGSSKFAPQNRWGYFPSAALTWKIKEEQFMKKLPVFSDLRLRLSAGQSGNNRIGNNLSDAIVALGSYGIGSALIRTAYFNNLSNPDLKWEAAQSVNLGLDVGLFKQRIALTAELYDNRSVDLLFNAPLSTTSGYATQLRNIGTTSSRGLELTLTTANIRNKSFSWNTNFNISFNRSKVLKLNDNQSQFLTRSYYAFNDFIVEVGKPVGQVYGYVKDGLYQVSDFDYDATRNVYTLKPGVVNDLTATNIRPGYIKLKDLNGDGVVDVNDRKVIGQTAPRVFGGINNTFSYKNFDLSIFLNFTAGNDIYNINKLVANAAVGSTAGAVNSFDYFKNRWTTVDGNGQFVNSPTALEALNKGKTIPSIAGVPNESKPTQDVIEDGSFLRINNINLGYTFPSTWVNKIGLSRARIYFTAYNLHVFTKYSGYDPEVSVVNNGGLTPGVDSGAYPRGKSFLAGLNVSF